MTRHTSLTLPSSELRVTLDEALCLRLILYDLRQQVVDALLLRRPSEQLVCTYSLASRVGGPQEACATPYLVCLVVVHDVDVGSVDQLLVERDLGDIAANITPGEFAALGEIVAFFVPGRIASIWRHGGGDESKEERADVLDVRLGPVVGALVDDEAFAAFECGFDILVHLDTHLVVGTTAGPIDARRANDGGADATSRVVPGCQDELFDIAVRSIVGEGGDLADAVPVIVDLLSLDAICALHPVLETQVSRTRNMEHVGRLRLLGETSNDSFRSADMITVGAVKHDVGFGSFLGEQGGAAEISVDEADLGVLRSNFGSFVTAAYEGRDFQVRVCVGYGVERVSADVAGRTGAMIVNSVLEPG